MLTLIAVNKATKKPAHAIWMNVDGKHVKTDVMGQLEVEKCVGDNATVIVNETSSSCTKKTEEITVKDECTARLITLAETSSQYNFSLTLKMSIF